MSDRNERAPRSPHDQQLFDAAIEPNTGNEEILKARRQFKTKMDAQINAAIEAVTRGRSASQSRLATKANNKRQN